MKKYTSAGIKEFLSGTPFDKGALFKKDPSYPKISIVTPSFNQGQFLERTILSILNQNYPNLEYLIIDGGSIDGSLQIIKRYAEFLFYWVSEKDRGQSDALNKGFARATGDIIGWQNSDDIYLPDAFYTVITAFNANDVDIVYSNRLDIDESDNVIGESRFTPFSLVGYWYEGMSLSTQSVFWRKSLFARVGMLDPNLQLAMDFEFFLRSGIKGAKFKHIRDYFGAFRMHRLTKTCTLATLWQGEHDTIDAMYGRRTYLDGLLKVYSIIRRVVYYILQKDYFYVIQGLVRRTLSMFK